LESDWSVQSYKIPESNKKPPDSVQNDLHSKCSVQEEVIKKKILKNYSLSAIASMYSQELRIFFAGGLEILARSPVI